MARQRYAFEAAIEPDQWDRDAADGRQSLRGMPGMCPAAIPVTGDVADEMQSVPDSPMRSDMAGNLLRIGRLGAERGQAAGDLGAGLSGPELLSTAQDPEGLAPAMQGVEAVP